MTQQTVSVAKEEPHTMTMIDKTVRPPSPLGPVTGHIPVPGSVLARHSLLLTLLLLLLWDTPRNIQEDPSPSIMPPKRARLNRLLNSWNERDLIMAFGSRSLIWKT